MLLKDRGGDRRGGGGRGVNGSLMKFFHKKPTYVSRSKPQTKPLKESDENTNQQDRNDSHKVTKPAEE
jgi:hypothetical protein